MLLRRLLPADLMTPLSAYLALKPAGASLLLESCDLGERVGRYSFVLLEGQGEVRLEPPGKGWVEALRRLSSVGPLQSETDAQADLPGPREAFPIGVGCAGYVGFEAIVALEPSLPLPMKNTLGLPSVWMRRFEAALVFDHLHQVAELQVLCADMNEGGPRGRSAPSPSPLVLPHVQSGQSPAITSDRSQGMARLDELVEQLQRVVTPVEPAHATKAMAQLGQAEYEAFVTATQERILDGDVYQMVPSHRVRVEDPPSPLEAYRRLRRLNPSPYGFLLEWNDFALVGASPEMLVRVSEGQAETLPIAGTVARGGSDEEDAQRFEALKRNPKELAEHQMLVDLARNDLGRIGVPGGVRVEKPLALQRTSHVLHLTTTVKAKLKEGLDALDVLASCFPAGTVSGAPKLRACQRIAELEGDMRGPYGGALVRLGADGVLDTALILRTAIYANGTAYLQAGAGIVRASIPASEYRETLQKMGAVAEALGIDLSEMAK